MVYDNDRHNGDELERPEWIFAFSLLSQIVPNWKTPYGQGPYLPWWALPKYLLNEWTHIFEWTSLLDHSRTWKKKSMKGVRVLVWEDMLGHSENLLLSLLKHVWLNFRNIVMWILNPQGHITGLSCWDCLIIFALFCLFHILWLSSPLLVPGFLPLVPLVISVGLQPPCLGLPLGSAPLRPCLVGTQSDDCLHGVKDPSGSHKGSSSALPSTPSGSAWRVWFKKREKRNFRAPRTAWGSLDLRNPWPMRHPKGEREPSWGWKGSRNTGKGGGRSQG